jgi:hypothetical protein
MKRVLLSRSGLVSLVVAMALLGSAPAFAASSVQTLSFSGGDFNSTIPTLVSVSPAAFPSWTAVVFTAHQFNNDTSLYDIDFVSSTNPSSLAASSSAPLAYTQSSGWFQYLRLQLGETGQVYVYYLQNSTSGSPLQVFSCTTCWLSNGTALGALTTNHESAINMGQEVFLNVQGGFLYVGTISATGSITYWVNGFGLPAHGLGGTWTSTGTSTTTLGGLTNLGGGCGAYYSTGAGKCHATSFSGNGYVQVEIDPPGFTNTQAVTSTTNVILQVVPLIVVVAVVGMVVGMLKKFKL